MKRIVLLLGAASVMLALLLPAFAGAAPKGKVTICHKGKNTLSISESALEAHLAHGDTIGHCKEKPDNGGKVVYYKKIVEVKKDGHKKIECTRAPNKGVVPKDSADNKFYTDSDCEKEKKVWVKNKEDKKKNYKCISVNKAKAVQEHKKMYKDGPSKKSKGCTVLYKKYHS